MEIPQGFRSKEEELYTLRYLQQLYQGQYSGISNEMNQLLGHIGELEAALKTAENYNIVNGKNTLMHIGANVYLNANASKSETMLVGVGGGWMVEKSIDDSKLYVSKRIEKMTALFNRLSKDRKELENALMEVSQRLGRLGR
jgi:prefoldin alpha subunit